MPPIVVRYRWGYRLVRSYHPRRRSNNNTCISNNKAEWEGTLILCRDPVARVDNHRACSRPDTGSTNNNTNRRMGGTVAMMDCGEASRVRTGDQGPGVG